MVKWEVFRLNESPTNIKIGVSWDGLGWRSGVYVDYILVIENIFLVYIKTLFKTQINELTYVYLLKRSVIFRNILYVIAGPVVASSVVVYRVHAGPYSLWVDEGRKRSLGKTHFLKIICFFIFFVSWVNLRNYENIQITRGHCFCWEMSHLWIVVG